jgi:hypothetical protein
MVLLDRTQGADAEAPGFLERWIATYIAELLDREAKSRSAEKAKVQAEIAAVVPALWEQQLARAALTIRRSVDWNDRRLEKGDKTTIGFLRQVLANPSHMAVPIGSETDSMQWLITAERLLTNYVFTIRTAYHVAATETSDSELVHLKAFLRNDSDAGEQRKVVLRLVPALRKIDTTNVAAIEEIVAKAIEHAILARLAIASSFAQRNKPAARTGAHAPRGNPRAGKAGKRIRAR